MKHKEKMHNLMKNKLDEIIKQDPIYGKVLEKIKQFYEKVYLESNKRPDSEPNSSKHNESNNLLLYKEKQRADKLEKENIELSKEYEKQCAVIESQKIQIKDLKNQISNNSAQNTTKISENNKSGESKKVESMILEIKALYKENAKLESMVKKLKTDLLVSKSKESTLSKLFEAKKQKNEISLAATTKNSVLTESKDLNQSVNLGKTKTKVVVPKLDFSKLPQKKKAQLKVIECEQKSASSMNDPVEQEESIGILGKMLNKKEKMLNENEIKNQDTENILDQAINEIEGSWNEVMNAK